MKRRLYLLLLGCSCALSGLVSEAKAEKNNPPAISLSKGGGAMRGLGEKFAANPVTGIGSMTVPIATSPGRSGFGPQLSLSATGRAPFHTPKTK
jgi:hypothetical protein